MKDSDLKRCVNDSQLKRNNEDYNCPICLGLVYKPKTCVKCESLLFCAGCIDQMQDKKCPYCSGSEFKDIHKVLTSILSKAEVECWVQNCSHKELTYDELVQRHAKTHWSKMIKCPIGCNAVLHSEGDHHKSALAHYDKCPLMMVKCDICGYNHFPN